MILSDQMIFVQRRKCVPFSIYTVFFLYEKVKKNCFGCKKTQFSLKDENKYMIYI